MSHSVTTTSSAAAMSLRSLLTRLRQLLTPPDLAAAQREYAMRTHAHAYTPVAAGGDDDDEDAGEDDEAAMIGGRIPASSVTTRAPSPSSRYHRRLLLLLLLFSLTLFLILDCFLIRRPYGLLSYHAFFERGRRSEQPPKSCGWDYEASWKIGRVTGSSSLTLSPSDATHPTLHCGSVSWLPASFVADPFFLRPAMYLPLPPLQQQQEEQQQQQTDSQQAPQRQQQLQRKRVLWQRSSKRTCDLSLAQLASSPSSSSSAPTTAPRSNTDGESFLLPGESQQCFNPVDAYERGSRERPTVIRASATAEHDDSHLSPSPPSAASAAATTATVRTDPFYAFYELKHLGTSLGEIGASVSFDGGETYEPIGTVLREKDKHLSYPYVFVGRVREEELARVDEQYAHTTTAAAPSSSSSSSSDAVVYHMIPETHQFLSIRIYVTDACCFPFGWRLLAERMRAGGEDDNDSAIVAALPAHRRFVDTSAVYTKGRWYIWTSIEYSLYLFFTVGEDAYDLANSKWMLHPQSPLYESDRRLGRNAGRIIDLSIASAVYSAAAAAATVTAAAAATATAPHPSSVDLLRPAQDCSGFYGESVHLRRVTVLSETEYEEEEARQLLPAVAAKRVAAAAAAATTTTAATVGLVDANYLKHRLHHIDMQWFPPLPPSSSSSPSSSSLSTTSSFSPSSSSSTGVWIGFLDGDDIGDDHHYWLREGWWMALKRCVLFTLAVATTAYAWYSALLHVYVLFPMQRRLPILLLRLRKFAFITTAKAVAIAEAAVLPPVQQQKRERGASLESGSSSSGSSIGAFPAPMAFSSLFSRLLRRPFLLALIRRLLLLLACAFVAAIAAAAMVERYPFCMSCTHAASHSGEHLHTLATSAAVRTAVTQLQLSAGGKSYHSLAEKSQAYASAFVRLPRTHMQLQQTDALGNPISDAPMQTVTTTRGALAAAAAAAASPTAAPPARLFLLFPAHADSFNELMNFIGSAQHWCTRTPQREGEDVAVDGSGSSSNSSSSSSGHSHSFRPPVEILVLDLGLLPSHTRILRCIRHLRLLQLPLSPSLSSSLPSSLPTHVRETENEAWKAIVLAALAVPMDDSAAAAADVPSSLREWSVHLSRLLSLTPSDAFLFISTSYEVRSSLTAVVEEMRSRGYVMAAHSSSSSSSSSSSFSSSSSSAAAAAAVPSVLSSLSPLTLRSLSLRTGVTAAAAAAAKMCNSDIVGFARQLSATAAVARVLLSAAACALDVTCYAPPPSSSTSAAAKTAAPSHPLFSLLFATAGMRCARIPMREVEEGADETLVVPVNADNRSSSGRRTMSAAATAAAATDPSSSSHSVRPYPFFSTVVFSYRRHSSSSSANDRHSEYALHRRFPYLKYVRRDVAPAATAATAGATGATATAAEEERCIVAAGGWDGNAVNPSLTVEQQQQYIDSLIPSFAAVTAPSSSSSSSSSFSLPQPRTALTSAHMRAAGAAATIGSSSIDSTAASVAAFLRAPAQEWSIVSSSAAVSDYRRFITAYLSSLPPAYVPPPYSPTATITPLPPLSVYDVSPLSLFSSTTTAATVARDGGSSFAYTGAPEVSLSSLLAQRMQCVWWWLFFLSLLLPLCSAHVRKCLFATRIRIVALLLLLAFLFLWLPFYQSALDRWGTFAPWNALLYTGVYTTAAAPADNAIHSVRIENAMLIANERASNGERQPTATTTVEAGFPSPPPSLHPQKTTFNLDVDSLHSDDPAYAISKEVRKLPFPSSSSSSSSSPDPSLLLAGPPPHWRPSARIVVSFTTMPHHVDKLEETIDSLLAQTMLPDAIYLNLPRGRNKRTNMTYTVAPYLRSKYNGTVFSILRCDDVGPLTKLVPTLDVEHDPRTFVITVDSDKVYHPLTVATLVWRSYHDPLAAFGMCGWSFYWQPAPMLVTPVYVPWLTRGKLGRSVDVLQACCGNVYRRGHFPDLQLLRQPHRKCFTTDDLWIAAYLAVRSHVKRVVINTPGTWSTVWGSIEPGTVSWKGSDPTEWQLSSHNTKRGVDMACIRGVEEALGPWRTIRQVENVFENAIDQAVV